MTLDPFTLLVALTVTHVLATTILVFAWYLNKSIPGVSFWTLGRVCITLALVAFTLRNAIPLPMSVLLGNGLLILGMHFIWQGNIAFMKRKPIRPILYLVLYGVLVSAMVYWTVVEPSFLARIVVSCFFIGVFDLLFVRALWLREGDEVYFSVKVMALVFVWSAFVQAARATIALSGGNGETLLEPSLATLMGLLNGLAVSMVSAMVYMAIIMEYLKKDLVRQAERDPLTGAFNRRAFHAIAEHILARARRERSAVSLVILDLDHFKTVNDTYGHMAGDAVLKRVVDLVHEVLRAQDVLVRLGGEEFAMLLPATTEDKANHVAERIRLAVENELFDIGATAVRITTSLGVTSISAMNGVVEIDNLIEQADIALYQAKDAGRNQVCLAS